MRRLVRHGLAGLAATTFAAVAAVTTLGADATPTAAPPPVAPAATGDFVPVQFVPADPVADAQRAATAERDSREAERTRIAAATAQAAYQRALGLATQGQAIDQQSSRIKAEIKAAKAKAEAAEAAAEAAEKKARDAAIANQGYTPGTTDVREIARQILANKFSYGEDQYACFSWIITRESNWNVHAENPSGAYGLPQSLPGSKMASVGPDWRDNPATQIIWGAQYMKSRYGSPCDAKSHWESAGNY
ncbi:hypothetical protein GCM10022197_37940 [Microlunatus spumicola]|uniref:Transglycosylase SLT domain-containing protein n=1 Tax=Microlunatus spumicola TaxID=81499 RepID=A0ABP6Y9T9_9ACTN